MKTTLKTLICAALCCAAGSAFATAPCRTPNITSGNATGTEGVPFSYTITATQSPTSFTATGQPASLTLNTSTGVISGTPATGDYQGSPYAVHLTATNACGSTGTADVTFTINPPPATTAISFNNNPATPDGTSATDVTITSTTTWEPGNQDEGQVQLQVATDGTGTLVPAGSVVTWVALDNLGFKTPNASGVVTFDLDLDNFSSYSTTTLPNVTCPTYDGQSIGFRTHYLACTGPSCTTPKAAGNFSPGLDLDIKCNPCPAIQASPTIVAAMASGNGAPAPGECGEWVYTITVMNCTGNDLTGVKIQGGSNGWSTQTAQSATGGTETFFGVSTKNKNTVTTWTGDIAFGDTVTITVTLDGCAPGKCPGSNGNVLNLNGGWSIKDANGNLLASYTEPITITETCP
jgi:hypothetical protein